MKIISMLALVLCAVPAVFSVAQDRPVAGESVVDAVSAAAEFRTSPAGVSQVEAHFKGSLECSVCHVTAQTKYQLNGVTDFVALNEFQFWLNDDPHSRAYLGIIPDRDHFDAVREQLTDLNEAVNRAADSASGSDLSAGVPEWGASNELSRAMLQKLFADKYGEQVENLFQKITGIQKASGGRLTRAQIAEVIPQLESTMQQCLSCHAGWDKRQADFDLEIIKYGTGVSCESCHGASSNWLASHTEPEWRKVDPRLKESRYGQYDVRDPIARAEKCYSCHIGDVEQGKIVTHEMYAAGHPPLPGIEIESFADQMPRHWRSLSEKPDFAFAEEFKKFYGLQRKAGEDRETGTPVPWSQAEFPRTKNLLVAGVMASSFSIDLMANLAGAADKLVSHEGQQATSLDPTAAWPEFATFDCAACHHDLKGDGRERGFAGVPGRPPAPYWPGVVAKLGVSYLDVQQQGNFQEAFRTHQNDFQAVLDDQPFGKPNELANAGSVFSAWLRNEVANQIESSPLDRDAAIAVLQILCGAHPESDFRPEDETWDFHSARQLAWSIHQVYTEIVQANERDQSRRNESFQTPDTEFGKILAAMREPLMLELPGKGAITDQQTRYLSTWRDFDRQQFFGQLEALGTALQSDPFVNAPPALDDQDKNGE